IYGPNPLEVRWGTSDGPRHAARVAGSVYSPSIREFAPGLWRMVFTADGRGELDSRSAIWTAVSIDREHWQLERELLGTSTSNLYYAALEGDQLVFLRWDLGQFQRLSIATITMP